MPERERATPGAPPPADEVDEASDDSFPASDPPSTQPLHPGAPAKQPPPVKPPAEPPPPRR